MLLASSTTGEHVGIVFLSQGLHFLRTLLHYVYKYTFHVYYLLNVIGGFLMAERSQGSLDIMIVLHHGH